MAAHETLSGGISPRRRRREASGSGSVPVFLIEHSLDVMKIADYVIELGPGGGMSGGELLYAGTPEGMLRSERSVTREYVEESLKGFIAE